MNVGEIKRAFREIGCVEDVRVWQRATTTRSLEGRRTVIGTGPEKIVVEAIPCDSTNVFNDVMKEHGLVIQSVDCGSRGLIATFKEEGSVHGGRGGDE